MTGAEPPLPDPASVEEIRGPYLAWMIGADAGALEYSRELLRAGAAGSLSGDVFRFRVRHRRAGGEVTEQNLVLKTGRHPAAWRDGVAARCRSRGLTALAGQVERHRDTFFAGVPLEIFAYREIVPRLPVVAPRVFHTLSDEATARYWIFMEEIAGATGEPAGGGATLWDERLLADLAGELGRLHATFFDGSGWELPPEPGLGRWSSTWIESTLPYWEEVARTGLPRCRDLLGRRGVALLEEACVRLPEIARRLERGPRTLVHGDCSPGNVFPAGRRLLFTDWGNVAHDTPAFDLHCLAHAVLDPSGDAGLVTRLADRYLAALSAAGCTPPGSGEFLELYELSVLRYAATRLLAVCCLADRGRDARPFRILERNVRWALAHGNAL
ncbi:MAG: phosphotransferase family protein [Candidatus Methylomirabilia bacterium]